MASCAFLRLGLIEEDLFPIHRAQLFVAARTGHVAMFALEREGRPLVMIEQRRFPLGRVMAIRARGDLISLGELLPVDILVAFLAFGRRLFEVGIDELGLEIRRLMAINTGHSPVRSLQRERSLIVVKAIEFPP